MSRVTILKCDFCESQDRVKKFGNSDLCKDCLKSHEIYKEAVQDILEELKDMPLEKTTKYWIQEKEAELTED